MDKFSDIKKTHKVIIKEKVEKINENLIVENIELTDIEAFFSKLFESKEMSHIYHLQTKGEEGSYAKHMALGSYYEGVLNLIDEIIEVYQGQYGIVENYQVIDTSATSKTDAIEYFESLANDIKENKFKAIKEEDTHLHSLLDDIVCLIYKTLYKLKYNK
tara:strand:+ start:2491 stop:2970 length:480 start_codon:yes stop_codon:yes gene_type:complete